jgi:4-hydroxy-tetrahydrodipicolinate synthase
MSSEIFGQVLTAMITPFNSQGEVNYAEAEKLADYLINNGSDGIVVCGTTGESPTLSSQEKYNLFSAVKNAIAHKGKLIVGTGGNCTQTAIEATKQAKKLGIDGTLQVVPYYNKPPQDGLYLHFQAIAKACADVPVMLYNVPGRTGCSLEASTVAKLAKIDNVVAIKEASGKIDLTCKIRNSTPDSFKIYSGDDIMTLPLMSVGCSGVVSVASHLAGNQMKQMITAFVNGNHQLATEIHLKLCPLFEVIFCTTNPIPVKAALNLKGWNVGGLRLPLWELSPELTVKVQEVLTEIDQVFSSKII